MSDSLNDMASLPLEDLQKKLDTTPDGLTAEEAKKRLLKHGLNEISEKKANPFLLFISYFWGPIPWMIEAAIILSAVVKHWPDFFIIALLLFANAFVGFWEEKEAGNAIAALKSKLAIKARVKRSGKWINPEAKTLVPGDLIKLRPGDIIPSDARLLFDATLEIDQSALTGESLPVKKKQGDSVFSGSLIRKGESEALVYATGTNTYFGKTAELVQDAHTTSHFQKAILRIGNHLIVLAAILVTIILLVALLRGDPLFKTLQFALVLTVAAIPVAMPTVLSVTMAIGGRLLAKKGAIVSKLVAIEELAGASVLCTDKTGTLTQNKLSLGEPYIVEGCSSEELFLSAALASKEENNDTIDLAILHSTAKEKLQGFSEISFSPFDPVSKRTEAVIQKEGGNFKVSKGAPQVILSLCKVEKETLAQAKKAIDSFAKKGYRSLGVAKTNEEGAWIFLGVLSLFDPPREDAKETISVANSIGVQVKMVTGDQLPIAKETAKTLGMGCNILEASLFEKQKPLTTSCIKNADGFAEVFPEHKFRIVEALQKEEYIVGMTGDGVNDAPALKKADCGIAVSGATDVARAAADIVLTTSSLSVIINAIKESRKIFERMNSYAVYRIAETLCVLIFMTLSILLLNFYPLTAIMVVMLALLNDGAILSIAYDNVLYAKKPKAWNMRLVLGISSVLGLIGPLAAFGLLYFSIHSFHLDHPHIQTLMYLFLSVAGHFTIFLTRTRGPFWSNKPANILLFAVIGTQAIATFVSVYGIFMHPIGWSLALLVWGYAFIWFIISDWIKLLMYKLLSPKKEN